MIERKDFYGVMRKCYTIKKSDNFLMINFYKVVVDLGLGVFSDYIGVCKLEKLPLVKCYYNLKDFKDRGGVISSDDILYYNCWHRIDTLPKRSVKYFLGKGVEMRDRYNDWSKGYSDKFKNVCQLLLSTVNKRYVDSNMLSVYPASFTNDYAWQIFEKEVNDCYGGVGGLLEPAVSEARARQDKFLDAVALFKGKKLASGDIVSCDKIDMLLSQNRIEEVSKLIHNGA